METLTAYGLRHGVAQRHADHHAVYAVGSLLRAGIGSICRLFRIGSLLGGEQALRDRLG